MKKLPLFRFALAIALPVLVTYAPDAAAFSGPVPDVTGYTLEDATRDIERANRRWGPFVVDGVFYETSLSIAEGLVTRTDPEAGTVLAPYSLVDVYVSTGLPPADTVVPNLVGLTELAAESALTTSGFVVGAIARQTSDTIPADTVISQNPTAGTLAPQGLTIDFLVSLGPPQPNQPVPNVTQFHLSTATATLEAAKLIPEVIAEKFTDEVPDDTVLMQTPVAGTLVFTGTVVNLVISRFGVALDNYVGQDYRGAIELLLSDDFVIDIVGDRDSIAPYGQVLEQFPLGPLADPGATITLWVSGDERFLSPPPVFDSSQLFWVRGFTGSGTNYGMALCVDHMGNVLTTGEFFGETDFDPAASGTFTLTPRDRSDMFVTKLDRNGLFEWAGSLGAVDRGAGLAIDTDDAGNIYVTGSFTAVDDIPLEVDGFVLKLDPDGDAEWFRLFDGIGQGIAVDGAGYVHVTGIINDNPAFFDTGNGAERTSLPMPGDELAFVWKLDTDGNLVWLNSFGANAGKDSPNAIVLGDAGAIYLTGGFEGAADLDPGPGVFNATAANEVSIFISKLDSNGALEWARVMDSPAGGGEGRALALGPEGNLYGTGWFYGAADFDAAAPSPIPLTTNGSRDVFVTKLTSGGDVLWAKHAGGSASEEGMGIAVDSRGYVITTGFFRFASDWDPGPGTFILPWAGFEDVFIWGLDSDGDFAFASSMGGPEFERPAGIALDGDDNLYLTGRYQTPTDLAPGDETFALPGAANLSHTFTGKYARVRPAGDIDGNGVADAVDIQYVINAVLGLAIPSTFDADVNGDDATNAADVQFVINAVLGI